MKTITKILLLLSCFLLPVASAQPQKINLFQADAYQMILNTYKDQSFMLVIWSVTCSSCLSEMVLIEQIHQQF